MTKPLDAAATTMRANLEANSGKSLEQWVAIAKRSGKRRHGEIVAHLKGEGLTYAKSWPETIAEQYSGEKASLKPIYDAIVEAAEKCGDVEIAPKKTYVSLRRSKQFAIIQPSTKTRVDLGLNIKGIGLRSTKHEGRSMRRAMLICVLLTDNMYKRPSVKVAGFAQFVRDRIRAPFRTAAVLAFLRQSPTRPFPDV